jgi:adenosylcobyric acid synthase
MTARVLMVQGASSSAGKSLLVAGLCRSFARRGIRVAPFKAQNMSNNAAVCPDGAEIGRAQAVQALAAGVPLSADLNPVLIKPEADTRSQVIVMGRPFKTLGAVEYYDYKHTLWGYVTAALDRLRLDHELVIIEGAGSPVELNLKENDIVNMAVARYAQAAVLLVGDIDRGGIFAQLLGTLWLLQPEERQLVRGLVVNKFRGDPALFSDGIRILEQKSGLPVLGVIPYLKDLHIPEEDAVALETDTSVPSSEKTEHIDIAILHLPRISNFDDFDPFRSDPGVRLRYVHIPRELGQPDAVILPGTKSTSADLEWLRRSGLAEPILQFARQGGAVVGICGGYQMLGTALHDPQQVESRQETTPGLALLPVQTVFVPEKATYQARARISAASGWMSVLNGESLAGYEIHMGRTESASAWLEILERNALPVCLPDGAASPDGRIWGCYLHGLFANPQLRHAWLTSLGWRGEAACPPDFPASAEQPFFQSSFDRLADALEAALDMPQLEKIIWES